MVTFSFSIRGFDKGSIGDPIQRIGKANLVFYIIGFSEYFSNRWRVIKGALLRGLFMKDQTLCKLEHGAVLLVDLYGVYSLVGGYHFIYATHSTPLHNPQGTEVRGGEKRKRKDNR